MWRALDPGPALGAHALGQRVQLLAHQPLQQRGIGQVHTRVILCEQVAADAAARLRIGLQPDEAHQRMTHIDFTLRQASTERRRATLPLRHIVERGLLGGVIIGDGQDHQLLQGDAAGPVIRHQARRDVRQFQTAQHHQRGHAEVGGDILDGATFLDQRGEGLELVGRVHLLAQQVLRKADGAGRGVRHQQARHLEVGGDALFLRQQLQGSQAAVAGHHLVMLAISGEDDDKVLQQANAGNARGQLVDGQARSRARVALGATRQELRERQQDQVLSWVGRLQGGRVAASVWVMAFMVIAPFMG